jgi:hypothetical protein
MYNLKIPTWNQVTPMRNLAVGNVRIPTPSVREVNDLNIVTGIAAIKQAAKTLGLSEADTNAAVDGMLSAMGYSPSEYGYFKSLNPAIAVEKAGIATGLSDSDIAQNKKYFSTQVNSLASQLVDAVKTDKISLAAAAADLGRDLKAAESERR